MLMQFALQFASATAAPLPPVPIITHYHGRRVDLALTASTTCLETGRYSAAFHQRTGQEIVVDELIGAGVPLAKSERERVAKALDGMVLEYAEIGCASETQALVDVAVTYRDGDHVRFASVPIFLTRGGAAPAHMRNRHQ